MADNNETGNDTHANPDTANASTQEDAALLDDLTVLSRGQATQEQEGPEDLTAAPDKAEGDGYENIQTSTRTNEVRDRATGDEDIIRDVGLDVARQNVLGGVQVPGQFSASNGVQDPVPFVDQPLPKANVDEHAPAPHGDVTPEPRNPEVVPPIGAQGEGSPLTSNGPTTPT
ncbi:MAG: hypothetical protein HZC24_10435, partial [Rhodocyclales bacterium]|nr:hypothetical protein [Rhodocyclales bacterium]